MEEPERSQGKEWKMNALYRESKLNSAFVRQWTLSKRYLKPDIRYVRAGYARTIAAVAAREASVKNSFSV